MKKHYFILLEILIALTLIVLLSIPLIRNPIYFYKKELCNLKEIELKNIENESFNMVKEMLFKNEVPLKKLIFEKKSETEFLPLPSQKFFIPGFTDKEIPIFYRITLQKLASNPKKVKENKYYRLNVEIALENQKNLYPPHTVIVQQIPLSNMEIKQ